jgi:hypothetical protein
MLASLLGVARLAGFAERACSSRGRFASTQKSLLMAISLASLAWMGCPAAGIGCLDVEDCVEAGLSCSDGQELFCNRMVSLLKTPSTAGSLTFPGSGQVSLPPCLPWCTPCSRPPDRASGRSANSPARTSRYDSSWPFCDTRPNARIAWI